MGSTEIANLRPKEIANNPDWFVRILRCRCLGRSWCLHSAGLQSNGLQLLAPEAFALYVEYRGIVKNPVQGTQQSIILVKVGPPMGRVFVAGEDDVEVAFFVVPSVNQVEEQPSILLVELTVPNFINN